MTKTSRARRSAVLAPITDEEYRLQSAKLSPLSHDYKKRKAKLERQRQLARSLGDPRALTWAEREFRRIFPRLYEMAQCFAHLQFAPYTSDEQASEMRPIGGRVDGDGVDYWVAQELNRRPTKRHPTEDAKVCRGVDYAVADRFNELAAKVPGFNIWLEVWGSPAPGISAEEPAKGGLRIVERRPGDLDDAIRLITPRGRQDIWLSDTLAKLCYLGMSPPVDPVTFNKAADMAWDKTLRHRKIGMDCKQLVHDRDDAMKVVELGYREEYLNLQAVKRKLADFVAGRLLIRNGKWTKTPY